MNKDLINSTIIDNIYVRATDGFRADLSIRSVFSGILGDVRRLDESESSIGLFNNTLNKIYDIAQLKVEFLNEQELRITHKELTYLLSLLAVDGFERLISYQVKWLIQCVETRLNKLEQFVDLLIPMTNREELIQQLVGAEWEAMSHRDVEAYYWNSQTDYYASLSDRELLEMRDDLA